MTIRAVIFDIGGVILLEAGEGLETKWERRLGLKEGGTRHRHASHPVPEYGPGHR